MVKYSESNCYRLVLIDSRIQDIDVILASLNSFTLGIVFDYETDTYKSIYEKVKSISLQTQEGNNSTTPIRINHIGILQHNYDSPFYNFVSSEPECLVYTVKTGDPFLETWDEFVTFFKRIVLEYEVYTIDLMACAIYSNDSWRYIVDELSGVLKVKVRASTNDTGNSESGGDWFLESNDGVNLKDVYFTEDIEKWKHLMSFYFSGWSGRRNYVDLGLPASRTFYNNITSLITLECWFKTQSTSVTTGFFISRWVMGGSLGSTSAYGGASWHLGIESAGKVFININNASAGGGGAITTASYADMAWHHAAGTYDSTTGAINIYVDGVSAGATTYASGLIQTVNTNRVCIGTDSAGVDGNQSDRWFVGFLSDVRLWNVARSAANISASYRRRLPSGDMTGIIGYWKLNESSGSAIDSGPNAYHGSTMSFITSDFVTNDSIFTATLSASIPTSNKNITETGTYSIAGFFTSNLPASYITYSTPTNNFCTVSASGDITLKATATSGGPATITATISADGVIANTVTATHTIRFLRTPVYNGPTTSVDKFFADIGSSFAASSFAPTSTSFTPTLSAPVYTYSVTYLSNQAFASASAQTATVSNTSSPTYSLVGTGQCYLTVTVAQDVTNGYLDTVIANFVLLTVRPGYIVGPNVNLTGAEIRNYNLNGVNFTSSNLTNARIVNCLLANANFSSAILTGATFIYNTITSTTNLTSATFTDLTSNNNTGTTTQLPGSWSIQGGRIIPSGTVFFSLSFTLAAPSASIPSGTGLSTTTPYNGDGHYRIEEGNLLINGKVESATNLSSNFIIRSTTQRYLLTQVGPTATYLFELINAPTSTGYSVNTIYIRAINNTTGLVVALPNLSTPQIFATSFLIVTAATPPPYYVIGSYLFGPGLSLNGTYFDNTISPKPDLTGRTFTNLSIGSITTEADILQGWNFTNTKLYDGSFKSVRFNDCNCNAVDFSGSSLSDLSFKITFTSENAAIPNIATLRNAKFTNCGTIRNIEFSGFNNESNALNQMDVIGLDFNGSSIEYIKTFFLNKTGGGPVNMRSIPVNGIQYSYNMLTDSLIGRFLAGPGMRLDSLTLGNANFSGINFSNADISGTNLSSASLSGIAIRTGELSYSNTTVLPSGYRIAKPTSTLISNPAFITGPNVDLSGVDATDINFEQSNVTGMNFTNARFFNVKSGGLIVNAGQSQPTLPSNYSIVNSYFVGPFVNLTQANLSNSTLTNTNLTGANFTNAVITGVTSGGITTTATINNVTYTQNPVLPSGYGLTRGYIIGPSMNFINTDLSGFDFTNVNLSGTNFTGSNFTYVVSGNTVSSASTLLPNASYAFLSGFIMGPRVNLTSKNVSGVKFSTSTVGGFTLSGSLFVNANLSTADFSGIILDGVNFTGATFQNTSSRNIPQPTVLPIFTSGQSAGYVIRNGYIIGANVDMSFTNLTGVDLSNTVLTGVNLTGSTLTNVRSGGISVISTSQPILPPKFKVLGGYLHGPRVDLSGANLTSYDFSTQANAINLSSANLTNAVFTNMKSGWIEIDSDASGPILSSPYVYNRRLATNPSGGFIIGPRVDLSTANFANFDLRNVLDLANVNFTNAILTNIKTSGSVATPTAGNFPTFTAGSGYVLYRGFIIGPNVNMSGTNLSTFVFGNNDTALVQGSTAALSGVNFSYANLTSANLLGSIVNGTNFAGSNFFRTRTGGLSYTNIAPTLPNAATRPVFDETNWYSLLTREISAGLITGSGPLVQSKLISGNLFEYGNWAYNNVSIASYTGMYFSEEIYWDPASGYSAGDDYYITFGAQSSNLNQGITIRFMFWSGYSNNGFSGAGIYLLKAGVALAKSSTLPNGSGPRQWFTVSVTYKKSVTTTWQVIIDGVSGLTYSDPDALTWAVSAGSWFVMGAGSGNGLRMSLSIRRLYLASTIASVYTYVTTTASGGYIIGPDVDLTQTNLQGASFVNVNFNNVIMTGATVSNTLSENLIYDASSSLPAGYIFITNNVSSTFIMGPKLNFASKPLTSCVIRNVDVTGTIFTGATLLNVKSSGITHSVNEPPVFAVGSGYRINSGFLVGPSVDLSGENMVGVDLSGDNLTSVNFVNADMSGANLYGTTLSYTVFTGASFNKIRSGGRIQFVSQPTMPSSSYKLVQNGYNESVANSGFQRFIVGPGSNCRGADFSGAYFDRVDLSGVDFTGASFTNVRSGIMRNTPILSSLPAGYGLVSGVSTQAIESQDPSYNNALYFVGPYANLTGAFLKNAEIYNLNVTGANFTGADFNGLSTAGLIGTPASFPRSTYFIRSGYIFGPQVNLSGGVFTGLDLSNSVLIGGNFTNANFTNANLFGSTITNALFTGGTMTGAKTGQINYQGYDYGDNPAGQDPSLPTSYRYVYNSKLETGYIFGPYVDVSGLDLSGINLSYTNLTGINLFGTDIRNVKSGNIIITNAVQPTFPPNSGYKILSGYLVGPYVDLRGNDFTNQDFSGTNLTGAIFTNAIFVNIKSGNIVASPVLPIFPDATFRLRNGYIFGPNVDLSFSDLSGMDLSGVNLTNARMQNTNFTNVRSGGVVGTSAFIRERYMIRNGYIIGEGVDLSGAVLTASNLSNAYFTNVNLTNVVFSNATLLSGAKSGGNLRYNATTLATMPTNYTIRGTYIVGPRVDLSGANLTNLDLSSTILTGVNMANATFTDMRSGGIQMLTSSPIIFSSGASYGSEYGYKYLNGYIVGPGVDLTGSNFADITITGVDLSGVKLSGSNLARIRSLNIAGTPASMPSGYKVTARHIIGPGLDMSGYNFTNGNFSGADITGSNLINAKFTNTSSGSVTGSAQTRFTTTTEPVNIKYQLSSGYIVGPGVDLSNGDLSGVSISGINLTGANVFNTKTGKVTHDVQTIVPSSNYTIIANYIIGPNVNLTGVDFSGVDLRYTNLTNVNFVNANLYNVRTGFIIGTPQQLPTFYSFIGGFIIGPSTDLSGADLSGGNLSGVSIENADLTNANFYNVSSGGIQGVPRKPLNAPYVVTTNGYIVGPNVDLNNATMTDIDLRGLTLTNALMLNVNFANTKTGNNIGVPRQLTPPYIHVQTTLSGGFIVGPSVDISYGNFSYADISTADLTNAKLSNSIFFQTRSGRMATGIPASLPSGYSILSTTVSGGYLVGPNVNLNDANFSGSNTILTGSNITNATMDRVNFDGAKMGGGGLVGPPSTINPLYRYIQSSASGGYIIGSNIDLSGANFTNTDISFVFVDGINFTNVNFTNTKSGRLQVRPSPSGTPPVFSTPYRLIFSTLSGGYIIGPNANLVDANLRDTDISATNLAEVNMSNANLTNMRSGRLDITGLTGTTTSPSLPPNYKYVITSVSGGYIIGPAQNLVGANFTGADLSFCNFSDSNILGAIFPSDPVSLRYVRSGGIPNTSVPSTLPPPYKFVTNSASGGYIIGPFSDLSGANLESSVLTGTDLSGANFTNARLRFARSGGIPNTSVPSTLPPPYKFVTNSASGGYIIGPFSDLSGANLESSVLTDTDLSGTNFTNARLRFARSGGIPNTSIPSVLPPPYKFITNSASGGYIIGPFSDLSGANLESSVLTGTDLFGANFTNALLRFVRSGGIPNTSVPATLPEPYKFITNSASGGYIIGPFSDLSGANLESSILTDTDLSGTNFTNARLRFARSGGIPNTSVPATLPPPYKFITNSASGGYIIGPFSDLSGANLESSVLTGTDLSGANFTNSRLRFARSGGIPNTSVPSVLPPPYKFITNSASGGYIIGPFSDLSGANLESSILTDTDLSGTNFTNARLRFARSGGIPNTSIPSALPPPYKFITNSASGGYIIGPFSDLSGANLESSVLTGADLSGANFANARLINTRTGLLSINGIPAVLPNNYRFIISAVTASGGYIIGPGVDLSGAVLTGTDLSGIIFSNTNIENALLSNAILVNVRSGGIQGTPLSFTSGYALVDGSGNNTSGAYIVGARVDLSGANLSNCILSGLDVSGANMFGAFMLNAKTGPGLVGPPRVFPSSSYNYVVNNSSGTGGYIIGPGVNISGASLSNVDLTNYDFRGVDITGVDLSGCNLTNVKSGQTIGPPAILPPSYVFMTDNSFGPFIVGPNVDLSGSNLTNCRFTGLNISGASFTNATLINVKSGGMTGPPSALPPTYRFVYDGLNGDNTAGYFIGPGVDLSGARLRNLNVTIDQVSGSTTVYNLDNAYLSNANITNASFSGTSMRNIRTGGMTGIPEALPTNFSLVVSASGGYFIGPESNLQNANLNSVVLTGMNISMADMAGATFINTRTGGLIGPPRTLTGGYYFVQRPGTGGSSGIPADAYILGPGVNLAAANLTGANLTNFDLSGSDLTNVTFTNTTLTNVNINNANLNGINPGTPIENNFTVRQNLQLLKNKNNRGIQRIRTAICLAGDIDVVSDSTNITYEPAYNRIYDHIRDISAAVLIIDQSGNSNLSGFNGRIFYIPSGPRESFYVDTSATLVTLPQSVPGNSQIAQYYHDVSGTRLIETSTGNTIRSLLVNNKVFLVFEASMLGVSIVDVYRALGFPAIYEVYSYYGTRNLALPEQVSRVYTVTGNGNVSLNWEPSFTDGKPRLGYIIEYVDQQPIARLYVPWIVYSDKYPLTNITITGLTNGTTYYFRVAAINVVGIGKYSNLVTCIPGTRPDAVSTLLINANTNTNTNTFVVEWTDPYNQGYPIDNYTIRYRKSVSNPPVNPPDTTWLDTTNITVITFQSNDSLISRIVRGTTTVLSYPIPISSPLETDLYEFQISGSNVLGTSDFKNTAPVRNTTLPDPQSMTVLPPNVVFSRFGGTSGKVSISSVIPTIIPDAGGKKIKLSWRVPDYTAYVPYAYALQYVVVPDVSGVPVPQPGSIPDASWNIVSPTTFTVSEDTIRSAVEGGPGTAAMTIISNLINGQKYSFKVAALNAVGRGAYSDALPTTVIPGSVPTVLDVATQLAFTINTETGGEITLYWLTPNRNGYNITNYRVRRRVSDSVEWSIVEIAVPAGVTNTSEYRKLTTLNLVNGTNYDFQVASKNLLGWSEYSDTLIASPRKVPDPISNIAASALNQGLRVTWNTQGVNNGGYPITGYQVQYNPVTVSVPSNEWKSVNIDGIYSSNTDLSGLVNGITHRIRVMQINAIGSSRPDLSTIIQAVPGVTSLAPNRLFISIGNARVTLFWTAPANTGTNDASYYYVQYKRSSDPDTAYEYVKNSGQTTPRQYGNSDVSLVPNAPGYDAFFARIEGLVNGTDYSVRVSAVTQVGQGQWSSPIEGKPGTVPSKVS